MPQFAADTFLSQFVWLVITFGVLYLIMARMALPKIATILESRRDRVANDLDEAETLKQQTDEAIAAYEQSLAEARNKAADITLETREAMNKEIEAERHKAEAEAQEKLAEAEKAITSARQAAMAEVDGIANEITEDLVKSLIGGRVGKVEVSKAVQAALGR